MDFQVGLTEDARADLREIVEFIARQSPSAAGRVGNELLDVAESLGVLPSRGEPVRHRSGMRRIFRWNYAIYYRVNESEKRVEVLRFWDTRRAPWRMKLPRANPS